MADLRMPKLDLTTSEGLVLEWRVGPGDAFASGDVLYVVETDKSAIEIEAEADGVVTEILVPEGQTVEVGVAVARFSIPVGN